MHRRSYARLAALTLPWLMGGCVQMTRHSNMLVFGTNTSFGIKVGTNPTSVPEVAIGYVRQEAVLVPLVANIAESGGNADLLAPCDVSRPIVADKARFAVHPCSLVAINGSALDSYSVLASFGAKFDGKGTSAQAEASGGLAQYFATGMAAQLLAQNGGASVVAISGAADTAAENRPDAAATKALFANPDAFARGQVLAGEYDNFQAELIAFVETPSLKEADLPSQMAILETDAGSNENIANNCKTKAACVAFIKANYAFSNRYDERKIKLANALAARKVANGL